MYLNLNNNTVMKSIDYSTNELKNGITGRILFLITTKEDLDVIKFKARVILDCSKTDINKKKEAIFHFNYLTYSLKMIIK